LILFFGLYAKGWIEAEVEERAQRHAIWAEEYVIWRDLAVNTQTLRIGTTLFVVPIMFDERLTRKDADFPGQPPASAAMMRAASDSTVDSPIVRTSLGLTLSYGRFPSVGDRICAAPKRALQEIVCHDPGLERVLSGLRLYNAADENLFAGTTVHRLGSLRDLLADVAFQEGKTEARCFVWNPDSGSFYCIAIRLVTGDILATWTPPNPNTPDRDQFIARQSRLVDAILLHGLAPEEDAEALRQVICAEIGRERKSLGPLCGG